MMKPRRICGVVGLLTVCSLALAQDGTLKVGLTFRGADSQIRYKDTQLLVNQDQFNRLWARNLGAPAGKPKASSIDFAKNVVLALFGGSTVNSEGFEVVEALDQEKTVLVRVQQVRFQSIGPGRRSTPFGFLVLPRIAKPYRVEENVQNLIGRPPVWNLRSELPAPPAR